MGFDFQAALIQTKANLLPNVGGLVELPHIATTEGHRVHRVQEFVVQADGSLPMGEGLVVALQLPAGVSGVDVQQAFLRKLLQGFLADLQRSFRLTAEEQGVCQIDPGGCILQVLADGFFYTSIPYEPGWRAWVDGEEVPLAQGYDPTADKVTTSDGVISFPLEKGDHEIVLKYETPGWKLGAGISGVSLLIFLLLLFSLQGHIA